MRRLVAVVVAVLLAAGIVWLLDSSLGGVGAEKSAVHRDAVLALVEQGEPDQARAEYQRLARRMTDEDSAFAEGGVLLAEGKAAEAVERLRSAYDERRDDARVLDYLAGALVDAGRQEEAWNVAQEHLARSPQERQVLWVAARSAFLPGDAVRCEAALELLERLEAAIEAATAAGQDPGVHVLQYLHLWANAALGADRHFQAVQRATMAVKYDPKDAPSQLLLAAVARRVADRRGGEPRLRQIAAEAYRAAARLDPSFEVQFDAAQFLLDVHGAEKECLRIAEGLYRDYSDRPEAVVLYARALVRQGDAASMDEAVQLYEALLKQRPEDTTVLRNLAVLYYDWKQGGQRGAYLRKAHDLLLRYQRAGGPMDTSLADVFRTLDAFAAGDAAASKAVSGHAAAMRGDADEAIRLYVEAAESDPSRFDYPFQLVGLLLTQPDRAEELERWSRRLVAGFPDEPRAVGARAMAILSRLGPIDQRPAERAVLIAAANDLCELLAAHPQDGGVHGQTAFVLSLLGGTGKLEEIRAAVPALAGLDETTLERLRQALLTIENQ